MVSTTARPLYPGKDLVPIVQEAGWVPGPVWTGAENLVPTGIRFPDRPASSESLYRLSYRGRAWWEDEQGNGIRCPDETSLFPASSKPTAVNIQTLLEPT